MQVTKVAVQAQILPTNARLRLNLHSSPLLYTFVNAGMQESEYEGAESSAATILFHELANTQRYIV